MRRAEAGPRGVRSAYRAAGMPRLGLLRDTDGDRPGGDSHRDRGGARKAGVEPEIKTFAFVSKRLALRRMAKRHPGFVQGIPSNPLPPRTRSCLGPSRMQGR